MQNLTWLICTSIFFLSACHLPGKKPADPGKNDGTAPSSASQSFFPVTDFLLGQLKETEALPVTPVKITDEGGRRDSVWLRKEDIRKFAVPFLHPVIDSVSMVNFFTEKSFMDQTINAVTFSYDPKSRLPDSIKLNHWDIYVDPQKNNVRRIYLVKEETINGDNVTTQLTWKTGQWCSIRTIIQPPGKAPRVKEEIMKWDFEE